MRYVSFFLSMILGTMAIAEGFVEDTLVKTSIGYVSIKDIKVGDLIVACDLKNNCAEKRVSNVHKKFTTSYYEIKTGNSVIGCDVDNKFYAPQLEDWTATSNLTKSTVLLISSFKPVGIAEIVRVDEQVLLYDLTVEDFHNFFVSKDDILAHNFVIAIAIPLGATLGEMLAAAGTGLVVTAGASLIAHQAGEKIRDAVQEMILNNQHSIPMQAQQAPQQSPPMSPEQLADAAKKLGYPNRVPPQKVPFPSHGKPGFKKNDREYLTPDVDRHKGGDFKKMVKRKGDWQREGTYDAKGNRLGD